MVELSQRSQQMQTAEHLVEEMRQRLLERKTRGRGKGNKESDSDKKGDLEREKEKIKYC